MYLCIILPETSDSSSNKLAQEPYLPLAAVRVERQSVECVSIEQLE